MNFIFINIGMLMFRGGGENYAVNIARALRDRGCRSELYTLRPMFSKAQLSVPDFFDKVYVLRSPWLYTITSMFHRNRLMRRLKGIRGIPRIIGQIIFELRVFVCLWRRRHESFVVHSCCLPLVSCLVTRFLNKKGLLRMPGPIDNPYDRYFGLRSAGIIANGNAYQRIRQDYNPSNLHFINVGVDYSEEPAEEALGLMRRKLNISSEHFVVLFVGRLIEVKNIPMLLSGFKGLLDFGINAKLFIVGDGPNAAQCRSMVSDLGLNSSIHLTGWMDADELTVTYRLADVCVLTSHYDNYPNVLIEAMACGTPCIGTSVGGIPDIVHHGIDGMLVQPNDCKGLAETLLRFACGEMKIDRTQLQKRTLKSFSWHQSACRMIDIANS